MFSAAKEILQAWRDWRDKPVEPVVGPIVQVYNDRYNHGVNMGSGFMVLNLLNYRKGDNIVIDVNDLKSIREKVRYDLKENV